MTATPTPPKNKLGRLNAFKSPKALFWLSTVMLGISLVLTTFNLAILARRDSINSVSAMRPFAPNTTVSQGVVSLKVNEVRHSGTKHNFVAPEGKEYVIITLEIKNRGDAPIQVLPTNDTYVKDSSGEVSYVTPFEIDQPFRAGELPPGETIKGQLSYLVNKRTGNVVYIDAVWSGGVIPIGLE